MLNFVICDDNLNLLDRLDKMLETIFSKNNYDASVAFKSDNADDILDYVDRNTVDVLMLDINLKSNKSGLELAKEVRRKKKNPYLIFTTGHLEYAMVAYKYKTFDYLPKPVTIERLLDTLDRLVDDMFGDDTKFVRLDNNKTIIKQDGIQYIQKDGMKVIFHTDTRDYETYSSFKKILPQLPHQFVQCHKSYIVNTKKITDVDVINNSIFLNNNENLKCYIGPKYKNQLMEVLNYGNLSNYLDSVNNAE